MVAVGIPGATPFGGHSGPVNCVAFSPDGTEFATGGQDGVVRLWDTATGQQTWQLTGHTHVVRAIAWSPDGTTIASTADSIRLWDAATRQQVRQLARHSHVVRAIAWSPDGAAIASAAGSVRLWDAATGRQTRQLTGHGGSVRAIAWSPDGGAIASAGGAEANVLMSGTVRLWDVATGRQTRELPGHTVAVKAIAWSPDGTTVAAGGDSGAVQLWDAATWQQALQLTGHTATLRTIAWHPESTAIATGTDHTVQLWDTSDGTRTKQLFESTEIIRAVAWSPGGTTIATAGGDDCTIRLWDATTGAQTRQLTGHSGSVLVAAWSPDGTTIATAGNRDVRLWDATTGAQTRQLTGHTGAVRALAWSPDSSTIATSGHDGTMRLWDPSTGQQVLRVDGGKLVIAIAWSPDGTTIATSVYDNTGGGSTHLREPTTGRPVIRLEGPDNAMARIAWSPDGTALATVGIDGSVATWDAATGRPTRRFHKPGGCVEAVAWSPDGTAIAGAGGGATIHIWDPATGQEIHQLTGHGGMIFEVAWSPDGTAIATASHDTTVRIWDPALGQQTRQLTGHTSSIFAVAWSPDGSAIVSGGADCTIRIWNPRSGTQVNGTGFGLARVPPRPLAGVRSDSPSETDLLGVAEDVDTLAELIAATETSPPLAIALIGDWGAGKSSVLLQMEKQVQQLSDRARNNPGLTAWVETVRQVRFNAWHYSDDQLWTGLVSHLFEVLAAPQAPEGGTAVKPGNVTAERVKLKADRDRKQRAYDLLDGELNTANAISRPAGSLAWTTSPWYATRVLLIVALQGFRDLRASLFAVLGWLVLGFGAYVAWHYVQGLVGALTAVVAVIVPPVTLAFGRIRAFIDGQRASLTARRQEYQRDIQSLNDQIVLVDAAERLARFLTERGGGSGSEAYREYRGLLGQVRVDLDQLAADLTGARRQWEIDGRGGPPPLERIVLYIDDLDRCPPGRVVEVLEAVHLMLALDLFVVVVAVDARWMIRSLEHHHHELFKGGGERAATTRTPAGEDGAGGSGADGGLATPIDYLDKIFQIPFALLPPGPDATADYLRSLLPEPTRDTRHATTSRRGDADAGGTDPAGTGPGTARTAADVPGGTDTATATPDENGAMAPRPDLGLEPDGWNRYAPNNDGAIPNRGSGRRERLASGAESLVKADATGIVELRPPGLQVSPVEVEFMAQLGGLLPTPRVAKRLVNLYRLVRIGIPSAELAGFVGDESGGPYQAVQVLLAVLVGYPEFAREVFRRILEGAGGGAGEAACRDLTAVAEEVHGTGGGAHSFGIIHPFLLKIREEAPLSVDMAECRRWCPQLARFSFYTRDLAGASRG
jgi:WD40 repeat protein